VDFSMQSCVRQMLQECPAPSAICDAGSFVIFNPAIMKNRCIIEDDAF
jgi:hypothetical protein